MDDPYATHLPVLRELAERVPMRRVLEFGAGRYSTRFFLSLPQLEQLVSVETDAEWREKVASDDPRHRVVARSPGLDGFDFIFIDNGTKATDRQRTIRRVLGGRHPVVAIHDAEVYDKMIRRCAENVTVSGVEPRTAVVW